MFDLRETRLELHFDRVAKAERRAANSVLARAAFAIRQTAVEIIEEHGGVPAPIGHPVHTRAGAARVAMAYARNKEQQTAVIGPRYSILGVSLTAHEFGILFRGYHYPKRPTMGPALTRNLDKLSGGFAAQITAS